MDKTLYDMVGKWRTNVILYGTEADKFVVMTMADELEAWAKAKAQEWRNFATLDEHDFHNYADELWPEEKP